MGLVPPCHITSFYRSYLREVRWLPSSYLRQYFQIKASDDFRVLLRSPNESVFKTRAKRIRKDLRKIEAAKAGNSNAFEHILDLAYGRKGKLKWELMEPLLSDPQASLPPPIIPPVEKSRPPVYSPELRVLLTTGLSRKTKPLDAIALKHPPILPLTADPSSDAARLLGPLSKRREVNIRWRFFEREWKKVWPPVQVIVNTLSGPGTDVASAGIRGFGMQGQGVFEDIERLVGPPTAPPPPTRRELEQGHGASEMRTRHPSRWLRRRYQHLLGRLPVLTYTPSNDPKRVPPGNYSVSLSPKAIASSLRHSSERFVEVERDEDLAWLGLANASKKPKPEIVSMIRPLDPCGCIVE